MIVRSLQPSDVPAIIHLGARMHEESQYSLLNFDPQRVADRCCQIIDSPDTMIGLVAVSAGEIIGMMGGYLAPYDYGDELTASDILVYVKPEHRGSMAFIRLVKKYVTWAKERGAKLIFLSQTTGVNQDLVCNLYTRLGFKPVGGIFSLEVA